MVASGGHVPLLPPLGSGTGTINKRGYGRMSNKQQARETKTFVLHDDRNCTCEILYMYIIIILT